MTSSHAEIYSKVISEVQVREIAVPADLLSYIELMKYFK